MGTWAQIILSVLRLLQWLIKQAEEQKWITEGEKRAIAKATAEVLVKQEFANETLRQVSALPDADLDDLLRNLEPNDGQLLQGVQKDNSEQGRRIDNSIKRG